MSNSDCNFGISPNAVTQTQGKWRASPASVTHIRPTCLFWRLILISILYFNYFKRKRKKSLSREISERYSMWDVFLDNWQFPELGICALSTTWWFAASSWEHVPRPGKQPSASYDLPSPLQLKGKFQTHVFPPPRLHLFAAWMQFVRWRWAKEREETRPACGPRALALVCVCVCLSLSFFFFFSAFFIMGN